MSDKPTPPPSINQNVISHNQSGGVTAHTVNLERPRRTVDETFRQQAASLLPKGKMIHIVAVMGDSEALAFALEINAYLRANGYVTEHPTNVSQGVFLNVVQPLGYDPAKNEITVGSRR